MSARVGSGCVNGSVRSGAGVQWRLGVVSGPPWWSGCLLNCWRGLGLGSAVLGCIRKL